MIDAPEPERPEVVLVPLGDAAGLRAQSILAELRASGIAADMGYRGNMKKRMSRANDSRASFAIILGDDELARGEAQLKSLGSGEQRAVPLSGLVQAIRQ